MGQNILTPGVFEGGGLSQTFSTAGGTLDLSADVAAVNNNSFFSLNLQGGRFELLIDGTVDASFTVGRIDRGATVRDHLSGTVTGVSPGTHTFEIRITRPFLSNDVTGSNNFTPLQYVTNLDVEGEPAATAAPEPSALVGGTIGVALALGYALRRRRARGKAAA